MTGSRKDILVGAAAASLSALWGCSSANTVVPFLNADADARRGASKDGVYDVIVVGAGPAGIAATRAVQSAKRSVLVLEAQDHIGGRCITSNVFPVPFDPGAQFVAESASLNNFIYPLMQELGVTLVNGGALPRVLYDPKTGQAANSYDTIAFYESFAAVDAALLTAGLATTLGAPDRTVQQVLVQNGLQNAPYLTLVTDLLVRAIDAGSPKDQSVLDWYNNAQFIPAAFVFPPMDEFLVPSGYGTFIARLAKGLPIVTSSPVSKIDLSTNPVTVTAGGTQYRAKQVIVTASVNVLKSGTIEITNLPKSYSAALDGLTMGHGFKAQLEFNGKPFDGHLGVRPGKMFTGLGLEDKLGIHVFGNYFQEQFPNLPHTYCMIFAEAELGNKLERMGPTNAGKEICAALEKPFPGITAAWTGRILTSSWLTNNYTRGCISYATVGNAGSRVTLSKPVAKKLWFAGEAISVHSHSFVNGAWASGTAAGYGALFEIGALTERQLRQLKAISTSTLRAIT